MADDGRCLHNEQKECAAVVCDVEHNWWYKHAKSIHNINLSITR